jgi:hypothetical protein
MFKCYVAWFGRAMFKCHMVWLGGQCLNAMWHNLGDQCLNATWHLTDQNYVWPITLMTTTQNINYTHVA